MDAQALTPKQVRETFFGSMCAKTFRRHEIAGRWRFALLSRPVGRYRYSRAAFEQYVAAQSVAKFGKGSRSLHLAS